MGDDRAEYGSPQEFVEDFLRRARPALVDLFDRRGGELESLHAEWSGPPGEPLVRVRAVVVFRGTRFSHRRRIWPPNHPAGTQAAIYATVLEERLLTRPRPPHGTGGGAPTEL
ncbi:hypothetical protein [Streptomyces meridianus]|uniref:Uncharacterized protein n=1 Tax=Streptomyces meridianus TaxID=2938945 RepID=A0ABT0X2Z6_9ACTN|nr:hypothetical protein [Streptomyces meridianus]MCM2576824.1 hypothetical protein [Streptomyces meridianus]